MQSKYQIYYEPNHVTCLNTGVVTTPIAFDLDSVLNEMGNTLDSWLEAHFAVDNCQDFSRGYRAFRFSHPDICGCQFAKAVSEYIKTESPSLLPTPFMAAVLEYVYDVLDRPILVVTARPSEHMGTTLKWIGENINVPVCCYMVGSHLKKIYYLNKHAVNIFVDDRFKTIKGMVGEIDYPVLYKREWNQGRPHNLRALQIRDLRDIIPLLNINLGMTPMTWPGWVPYPKPYGERKSKKYATIS